MDGEMVSWDQARVHVLSYTLHYGLGAFEGIRAYTTGDGTGAIFRLPEHSERLVSSMQLCNLDMKYSAKDVIRAVTQTFEVNGLTQAYARPLAYVGSGGMGLFAYKNPVHLSVAVWSWGAYLGEEGREKGIRCCISSFQRLHGTGILTKGKIPGHYVNSILAKEEAVRNGYEEGLMVDDEGHVLEGTGENLFIVKGNEIITPPLQSAILGGVTRDTIIKLAQEMGYSVVGKLFGRDTIYLADEVFLTGTAAEVTPVREVDGRTVGTGRPGPITRALIERYHQVVRGKVPEHDEWLTHFETEG
jgi:branched-chain amino acid aminotransferase